MATGTHGAQPHALTSESGTLTGRLLHAAAEVFAEKGYEKAGVAAIAQNRDIQLNSVVATLEGGMDIQGILGMDSDIRNGFDGIKVSYKIDADASPKDIEALVAQSQKRSAVYDIVTNPTNVTVEVN